MIEIVLIKIILVIFSVLSLGIIPLLALLNMWIWNEIIVNYVLTCAMPITSYWIMLGLTTIGSGAGLPLAYLKNYTSKGSEK